jgi:diguanylate cyclase (GGDEF)-like protein
MRLRATVRVKVLLVSALLLAALMSVAMAVMMTVIRPTFEALETEHARDHAALIQNVVRQELDALGILVADWAAWDDTYTYVADRHPAYETSNLIPETFTGAGLNLILIRDTDGAVVWSGAYDLDADGYVVSRTFSPGSETLERLADLVAARPGGVEGFIRSDLGPMLLAARSILTSQEEGPSRGMLVMGRLLSDATVDRVSAIIGQPLVLWPADDPSLPPAAAATVAPTGETQVSLTKDADGTTGIFVGLRDVFGEPALVLGSSMPRNISDAGHAALISAGLMIAVAGTALIAVFGWSQQRMVLGPLNRLTRHIESLAKNGDLTETLDLVERRDELGTLAKAFNQMQARIAQLAYFDAVTGLPNRLLFRDRAEQILRIARRNGERAAILFLDLDGFKTINDTRGHSAGDALLRTIAIELHGMLRDSDTIARFGGDEFVIILQGLREPEQERGLADRLMSRFARPFRVGSETLFSGASIGVATFPDDGETVDDLVACADAAMYLAKGDGGHRVSFHDVSRRRDTEHLMDLEQSFRQALVGESLFLVFQPMVDLSTGQVVSHEALVRWRHPDRGVLTADSFIHLADRGGLFAHLDTWVLRAACTALAHARRAAAEGAAPGRGPVLDTISVNLCARHVESDDLVGIVSGILRETGVEASRLVLEVTESVMISRPEAALRVLNGLRDLGVRIAIDDFGTGYASLSALHRFPADIVKIDRSFIAGIPDDPVATAITRSTITLVRSLGTTVVAEGVETVAQRDFLQEAGCPIGQGFLLGA